jgi:hypothetical protein
MTTARGRALAQDGKEGWLIDQLMSEAIACRTVFFFEPITRMKADHAELCNYCKGHFSLGNGLNYLKHLLLKSSDGFLPTDTPPKDNLRPATNGCRPFSSGSLRGSSHRLRE